MSRFRLSTIITFAEDGAHDARYFNNPTDIFRGTPRRPWIDTTSEKLLYRHVNLVAISEYLRSKGESVDALQTLDFFRKFFSNLIVYLENFSNYSAKLIGDSDQKNFSYLHKNQLERDKNKRMKKQEEHPEVYLDNESDSGKSLLDALYEEGIIPIPGDDVKTFRDARGNDIGCPYARAYAVDLIRDGVR